MLKFSIKAKELLAAIDLASNCVDRRGYDVVLKSVVIEANKDGRVILRATNMDSSIVVGLSTVIDGDGTALVDCAQLRAALQGAGDNDILFQEIGSSGKKIKASFGKSVYKFSLGNCKHFPDVFRDEADDYDFDFVFTVDALQEMISRIAVCMSTEEIRPTLNGINFAVPSGKKLTIAQSTNGHMMAWHHLLPERPKDIDTSFIVSRKSVYIINNILKQKKSGDVKMSVGKTKVKLDFGDTIYFSRLVDDYGKPNNFSKVVPTDDMIASRAVVDRAALIDLLSQAQSMMLAGDESSNHAVCFSFEKNKIKISASVKGDISNFDGDVEADFNGEPMYLYFNNKYILSILSADDSPGVALFMNNLSKPVMIKATEGSMDFFLIMPLNMIKGESRNEV